MSHIYSLLKKIDRGGYFTQIIFVVVLSERDDSGLRLTTVTCPDDSMIP